MDLLRKIGMSKKQGNEIDTRGFKIRENTIYYSCEENRETVLQISSISQIDIGPSPEEEIPGIIIALLLLGLCLLGFKKIILGAIMALAAGIVICIIESRNAEVKDNLIIHLNNGEYFCFVFRDRAFLRKVLDVLITCVNHRISEEVIINISNSTIQSSIIGNHSRVEV